MRERAMTRFAKGLGVVLVFGVAACDCGDDMVVPPPGPCMDLCVAAVPPATMGSICCEPTDMCVSYDFLTLCDPGFACSGHEALVLDETCNLTCSDCVQLPPLAPGILATHLDMHLAEDGSISLSGYSPGNPAGSAYGDLVFGTWDPGAMSVDWEIVDGAPSSPITNDVTGWRAGVSAPGDDVGLWTSIGESGGTYYIAYYDKTNGALKLAIGTSGSWQASVVDDTGDSGRYASLAFDPSGNPVIAYLQMIQATDGSGRVVSTARVATAASPMPAGPTDWASTEIGAADMACRPELCDTGTCLEDGLCGDESMGTALADPYVEDMPPAYGMYNSLVATATGFALVYYDRTAGNIMGAEYDGAWNAPFLIDGYGAMRPAVGDSGIGASLFVDSGGTWHVTYADGAEETLRYATVTGTTATPEVVDNGATDGTAPNPDGRHIVGDDSSVVATEGGEVRVVYQDATEQRVMLARRASGGAWEISILDESDSTGYWLEHHLLGTTSFIATFWRNSGGDNGIRIFDLE
jgi:hypothetical protein